MLMCIFVLFILMVCSMFRFLIVRIGIFGLGMVVVMCYVLVMVLVLVLVCGLEVGCVIMMFLDVVV